jgi:hypothetical protein
LKSWHKAGTPAFRTGTPAFWKSPNIKHVFEIENGTLPHLPTILLEAYPRLPSAAFPKAPQQGGNWPGSLGGNWQGI